ncbi:uncharacterized protein DSM5745_07285 [Aspergillus mulundensis]|uniref:DUF7791 domain-containing protein n=1 Tax=Aspergillus mulundensis TaxID=1810919 RepID=A0A3D8RKR8_9EURO|nr:hypothetical protein DSM5745_07285 [Aspergillus mulundensis]RDW74623.1 hypothetical protein DSM5745_07285 [Aspergillus mulundensis]
MCSYSNIEIEERLESVQKQLRDLTKGMLEVRPWENIDNIDYWDASSTRHPFFASRVGFFHRTFRDYLLARWHDKMPPNFETYVRMALAEIKFSCSIDFHQIFGYFGWPGFPILDYITDTLIWLGLKEISLPDQYYEEIERVIDGYEKLFNSSTQGRKRYKEHPSMTGIILPVMMYGRSIRADSLSEEAKARIRRPFSFLSYLALYAPTSPYFIQRIMEFPQPQRPNDNLVHAFATLSHHDSAYTAKLLPHFLEKGVTPNSLLTVWLVERDQTVKPLTVPAWLTFLVSRAMGYFHVTTFKNLFSDGDWRLMETFLKSGMDSDIIFLFEPRGHYDEDRMRYLDLSQLIEFCLPENIQSLRMLLDRPTSRIGQWWNGARNIGSIWTSHRQPDYAGETRTRYRQATASELNEDIKIKAIMTRLHKIHDNFVIQLY